MKTTLPELKRDERSKMPAYIHSIEEAREFLKALFDNGEEYHPEDNASEVINGRTNEELFEADEAEALNQIMQEIYALDGNFDPCQWLNELAFRKQYSIEAFEKQTGYFVSECDETEVVSAEEVYGGNCDRYLTLNRGDGKLLFMAIANDLFLLTFDCEGYHNASIMKLKDDIQCAFESLYA